MVADAAPILRVAQHPDEVVGSRLLRDLYVSLVVLLLEHLRQENRPSALLGMLTRVLKLLPLVVSAVYSNITLAVRLNDSHFLLAIAAFIRHHARNTETHGRTMLLHLLILFQRLDDAVVECWVVVSHRLMNAAISCTSKRAYTTVLAKIRKRGTWSHQIPHTFRLL